MEAKVLPSNESWGKRSGSWDASAPNVGTKPIGNVFRQSQWGSGTNNSKPKVKGMPQQPKMGRK